MLSFRKVFVEVLGSAPVPADQSGEGKPPYYVTIAGLGESRSLPGVPPKPEPGRLKSFFDLPPGEYVVEIQCGSFLDKKGKHGAYGRITKVHKGLNK